MRSSHLPPRVLRVRLKWCLLLYRDTVGRVIPRRCAALLAKSGTLLWGSSCPVQRICVVERFRESVCVTVQSAGWCFHVCVSPRVHVARGPPPASASRSTTSGFRHLTCTAASSNAPSRHRTIPQSEQKRRCQKSTSGPCTRVAAPAARRDELTSPRGDCGYTLHPCHAPRARPWQCSTVPGPHYSQCASASPPNSFSHCSAIKASMLVLSAVSMSSASSESKPSAKFWELSPGPAGRRAIQNPHPCTNMLVTGPNKS